ncbi:MAG: hypothetical protein SVY53_02055 [Chloroflexota bacterium]|nr:hypothetical protein [Chloroflexota bacterium]
MRTYNKYILTLAVALLLTTIGLAATGETRLDFYYTVYLIECLIITSLFSHVDTRARRGLNIVSYLLLAGFGFIVLETIAEILLGTSML